MEQRKPAWQESNRGGEVHGNVNVITLKGSIISRIMRPEKVPGITHGAKAGKCSALSATAHGSDYRGRSRLVGTPKKRNFGD